MKEADFYTVEETAKALRVSVRRVFGMLCSGELEGNQDEWARWRVPASAVQHVRRAPEPSYGPGESQGEVEPGAVEGKARAGDATTVRNEGSPLWRPQSTPGGVDLSSDEEITQEAGEALMSESPALDDQTESGDMEITERLPRQHYRETEPSDVAPEETIRELTERLDAAVAENRELRARLEHAEITETALRESLERERQRADREGAQAEQEHRPMERHEEEPGARPDEGFWRRLAGG